MVTKGSVVNPAGEAVDRVSVGDRMRFSVELVDTLKARPSDLTVLVRVTDIRKLDDGLIVLWLENDADESRDESASDRIWRER